MYKASERPEVDMEFRHVLVAGGGVLGAQIAFQTAFKGFPVTIWLRSEGSIGRTEPKLARLYNVYRAELARVGEAMLAGKPLDLPRGFGDAAAVKSAEDLDRLEKAVEAAKQNIRLSLDLEESAREADFIIESMAEDREAKREFYAKLAPFLDEKTIVATNSSTMIPSMFSDLLPYPKNYLALHFANNIWRSNTAEIMGHSGTSEAVFGRVVEFAKEIGMIPLELKKEQPGYILNSMLVPFLSAAEALWANEVADPETIDKTWTLGTGSPYGPFRILDIVGLQTAYNIVSMNPEAKNPESTAGKIAAGLKAKIDAGKTGVNAGEGFYRYEK